MPPSAVACHDGCLPQHLDAKTCCMHPSLRLRDQVKMCPGHPAANVLWHSVPWGMPAWQGPQQSACMHLDKLGQMSAEAKCFQQSGGEGTRMAFDGHSNVWYGHAGQGLSLIMKAGALRHTLCQVSNVAVRDTRSRVSVSVSQVLQGSQHSPTLRPAPPARSAAPKRSGRVAAPCMQPQLAGAMSVCGRCRLQARVRAG